MTRESPQPGGSSRERALKLILPALVAGTIYVFAFARGLTTEVRNAELALEQARKESPATAGVSREMGKGADLPAEIEKLAAESARLEALLGASDAGAPDASQIEASSWLTGVFSAHGLTLLEERLEAVPAAASAVIPEALRRRAASTPGAGPGLRALTFEGGYLDVLGALEAIAASDRGVFPIRLTTGRAEDGTGRRVWRLLVWI